jgi:hypothetical protein
MVSIYSQYKINTSRSATGCVLIATIVAVVIETLVFVPHLINL